MRKRTSHTVLVLLFVFTAAVFTAAPQQGQAQEQPLEFRLKGEGARSLAQAARKDGDAARGAIVFHQPQTTCAKCHVVDGGQLSLGPELTSLPKETTDEHLVESL